MAEISTSGPTYGQLSKESVLQKTGAFWCRFLGIAVLHLFIPLSLFASDQKILEALSGFQNSPKSSVQILEGLSADSPHFQIAVEELMKFFYTQQRWEKFFSYAQYYRQNWKAQERKEVQLLEALALLRHCQNEILEALLFELEAQLSPPPAELEQIRALSATQFQAKASSKKPKSKIAEHSRGTSLWETRRELVGKVHPSKLQVRLENQCAS